MTEEEMKAFVKKLSDDELRHLESIASNEGLERGFPNYWWE